VYRHLRNKAWALLGPVPSSACAIGSSIHTSRWVSPGSPCLQQERARQEGPGHMAWPVTTCKNTRSNPHHPGMETHQTCLQGHYSLLSATGDSSKLQLPRGGHRVRKTPCNVQHAWEHARRHGSTPLTSQLFRAAAARCVGSRAQRSAGPATRRLA
jgi:hypothetical protein